MHFGRLKISTVLRRSANDRGVVENSDFEVTNNFWQVGELTDMDSMNDQFDLHYF